MHGHNQQSASTSLFRRLIWEGTVPVEIKIDAKELPANSDRGLEYYYIQAPRISYLPLLIPDIRRHLADIVLDDAASTLVKEEDWWFEETGTGALMKWHWPIGLLYDNHVVSALVASSINSTFLNTAESSDTTPARPLRLTLHLASPPSDKLLMTPSTEACKQAFMGQIKEADFLRWGNTKRVTGLRKQEQDGMWEGVREHNFDEFWKVASKIFPTPTPHPTAVSSPSHNNPSPSAHPRSQSTDPGGLPDRDGAYNVRSVPVRIYLPDGPVMQDLAPPLTEDGRPTSLRQFLRSHLPLLFPPSPSVPLAYAVVQGVVTPGEAEIAWMGACLAGADGWLNVFIGLGVGRG